MGNINGKAKILGKKQTYISCSKMYLSKTNTFILSKNFKDFEDIKKGDCIWYDGQKKITSKIDGVILFAHNADAIDKECFILARYL